jgi:hypothetical protein
LGAAYNPVRAGPDEEDECESGTKFIFVGFSHASRLALAADKLSLTYSVVNLTGGKITAAAVDEACEQLKDEVCTAVGKVVVIYHIFDNNAYFCVDEDGSKSLPTKNGGGDGRYHVKGRLEVAEHSVIKSLVNLSIGLFRAGGEAEKIIFSPFPRFMIPCCMDDDHVTNRSEPDFKEKLLGDLKEVRRLLKDLIFGKKICNFKVLDPLTLMYGDEDGGGEKKGFWRLDPVHPSPAGYANLMSELLKCHSTVTYTRSSEKNAGGRGGGGKVKRKAWIDQDNTTAHRVYPERGRGNSRGRGGHRGRRPWKKGGGGGRGGGGGFNRGRGDNKFRPY